MAVCSKTGVDAWAELAGPLGRICSIWLQLTFSTSVAIGVLLCLSAACTASMKALLGTGANILAGERPLLN